MVDEYEESRVMDVDAAITYASLNEPSENPLSFPDIDADKSGKVGVGASTTDTYMNKLSENPFSVLDIDGDSGHVLEATPGLQYEEEQEIRASRELVSFYKITHGANLFPELTSDAEQRLIVEAQIKYEEEILSYVSKREVGHTVKLTDVLASDGPESKTAAFHKSNVNRKHTMDTAGGSIRDILDIGQWGVNKIYDVTLGQLHADPEVAADIKKIEVNQGLQPLSAILRDKLIPGTRLSGEYPMNPLELFRGFLFLAKYFKNSFMKNTKKYIVLISMISSARIHRHSAFCTTFAVVLADIGPSIGRLGMTLANVGASSDDAQLAFGRFFDRAIHNAVKYNRGNAISTSPVYKIIKESWLQDQNPSVLNKDVQQLVDGVQKQEAVHMEEFRRRLTSALFNTTGNEAVVGKYTTRAQFKLAQKNMASRFQDALSMDKQGKITTRVIEDMFSERGMNFYAFLSSASAEVKLNAL